MQNGCAICKNNKPFELPEEIVAAAMDGSLALFCGAGISTESRQVLPWSFFESIEEELGINETDMSFSELMSKYCDQPNGRRKLFKKIRERFQYIHSFPELERQATLFHRELAEIHSIRTIVTTNWDDYFERYCGAIPVSIPDDISFWDNDLRCVLKVHGTINNLKTVVATTEDYEKCYDSLQNGCIGALLKSILSTKTVVFIGFSFGDEDLLKIFEYLRKEMDTIYPHVYFVTLDDTLKDRMNYNNSTAIITSGVFFLQTLKDVLIQRRFIVNAGAKCIIPTILEELKNMHEMISEIDLIQYPSAIYTLSYQDGVTHAFERFLQNIETGEYNCPGRITRIVNNYGEIIIKRKDEGDYWDVAYYEGYINGLILIEACEDISAVEAFPFVYLPNAKEPLDNHQIYMRELKRVTTRKSKYHRYAEKLIRERSAPGLTVHHPPY